MVGVGTVFVTWAATTVCFVLVYFFGRVYRADGKEKFSLALWYVSAVIAYVVSWIAVAQGKDELAAVLLRMTPIMAFFFVVVGRVYRTKTWENVLFIAMAAIIFGVPLWRAWESGDVSEMQPRSMALLERMVALFAAAGVAYGIWKAKSAHRSQDDSSR